MIMCPSCGFSFMPESEFGRKRAVTRKGIEDFVERNMALIQKEGISKSVLWLARKELQYSLKTADMDIVGGLYRTYNKIVNRMN